MSYTSQRTYGAETWREADAAWRAGAFGAEWEPWRKLAAQVGLLFPPKGGRWDSWDASEPSQRALLQRAMDEDPDVLRWALRQQPRDWWQVVRAVLQERDQLGIAIEQEEASDRAEHLARQPTNSEATRALADIFEVVAASLGYVKGGGPSDSSTKE